MNQIRVSREMDCVVAFSTTADPNSNSSVLIYTSSLSLRAFIHSLPVKDCFITRAGILLIGPKKVTKIDFVGRIEKELLLAKEL